MAQAVLQIEGAGFISWPETSCHESYVLPVSVQMFPPGTSAPDGTFPESVGFISGVRLGKSS